MIYRPNDKGWIMISQAAHAWMTGELATTWGNAAFAVPNPHEAVILATRLHDIGWLAWDAAPRLDEAGKPVNFINLTLAETIPIWRRAVQDVALINPYSALLISLHAATIYRRRRERGVDPPDQQGRLIELLAEEAARQRNLAAQLVDHPRYGPLVEEKRYRHIYRWLRACDLISLALLSDALPPSGEIRSVPGKDWSELTTIQYVYQKPYTLVLNPSPFAKQTMHISVDARYLDQVAYPGLAHFQSALAKAPWVSLPLTVKSAS